MSNFIHDSALDLFYTCLGINYNIVKTVGKEADDFFDIRQKEKIVMTKNEVLQVVNKFSHIPMGSRLIQIVTDELKSRVKNSIKNMSIDSFDDSESVAKNEQAEDNRIENDYGGALSTINHYAWVNVKHVAQRLLKRTDISATEWLYTKIELTGLCDKNMRYVMIDEVQDYTKAQMMVFMKYFPNARFMLLGDEFQSIRRGTVSFAEIEEMVSEAGKKFALLPLMTSYRSSPEITDMFASVLPKDRKLLVSSVKRPGEKPIVKAFDSDKEYYKELLTLIKEFEKKEGLTAIICRNPLNIERIIAALKDKAPSEITVQDALPKEGIFLIELTLAKGLEFDQVILADADSENYPADLIGDHCLYTAMSRATQHLAILSRGQIALQLAHLT